jgi:hypothetical protein
VRVGKLPNRARNYLERLGDVLTPFVQSDGDWRQLRTLRSLRGCCIRVLLRRAARVEGSSLSSALRLLQINEPMVHARPGGKAPREVVGLASGALSIGERTGAVRRGNPIKARDSRPVVSAQRIAVRRAARFTTSRRVEYRWRLTGRAFVPTLLSGFLVVPAVLLAGVVGIVLICLLALVAVAIAMVIALAFTLLFLSGWRLRPSREQRQ